MEQLKYKPNRLWPLDLPTPATDVSGYGVNAVTPSGTTITNYQPNPSMIGGSGSTMPTGYTKYPPTGNTGTYTMVTSPWDPSMQAISMTIGTSGSDTRIIGTKVNCVPGQTITFLIRYQGPSARANQLLLWTDINGTFISSASKVPTPDANGWSRLTTVAPANAYGAGPQLYCAGSDQAGDIHIFSQWLVATENYQGPYFDGDTAVAANATYAWTGTPHNSPSIQTSYSVAIPLSGAADLSQVVNSSSYISFPQNVYISGKERQEFSLAASVFLPDTGGSGDQQILSNLGRADGLSINGNVVSFSTAYASNGSAICSYQIPENKRVDVVGVHTRTKNLLYIDGALVDSVDITDVQQADVYASTDGNLYAGRMNAENMLISTVGIFPRALHDDEISNIYASNTALSVTDPINALGGEVVDVSGNSRPPYLNISWTDADDWNSATLQSVFVDDDGYLKPEMIDTATTVAGVWTNTVNIYASDVPTAINSMYMWWDGLNVLVETSVDDGATWVTVVRGTNLTNVPQGFDPTNKTLQIRATFTGNVTEAYLGNMRLVGYLTNTAQQPSGRILTYTNPVTTLPDQQPSQLREDWGTKITGGTLSIGTDTTSDTPMSVQSVEVWMKQLTDTAPTLSSNLTTGTTVYTNGVAGLTLRRGEWNVVHYTSSTPITGALTFSGNVQIGRVVLYSSQLYSTDISNLIANYTGRLLATNANGGIVNIIEPASSANIYAHDWANA